MTMVALLGNPVESASPLTLATPHTLSQMLTEPTATNPTPQLKETPISHSIASLRDIPTDVPTTAATSDIYNANDDDRCRTCPSINDDNKTLDPTSLPTWDYRTFLKERLALYNELFPPSTGALIVSTQETQTVPITPADSIVATSDPPAATDPDRITLPKELDALPNALHNELTCMRSTGTLLTCTTDDNYISTTVTPDNDRDQIVNICDERHSNETHHDENQHSNHGYAHHPHDNHASNPRVHEISDADRTANDCRRDDDQNKTNATEQAAHDNNTCENDGCIQPMSPMRHSRQYTPTFPIIGSAINNQHQCQTNLAPSARKQREVETTHAANIHDPTLAQLWIVLEQLEEINIQFARWVDTLTSERTTTTPDNTPGNQMNPLDAPIVTMPTIIQSTPSQHNKYPAYTFLATRVNDPTGGMFFLLPALDRHSPTVRPPPWPPPTPQTKGPNKDHPQNRTQITNLLPTPDTRLFRLMLHRHNPIWPSPIPRRTCALLNCT